MFFETKTYGKFHLHYNKWMSEQVPDLVHFLQTTTEKKYFCHLLMQGKKCFQLLIWKLHKKNHLQESVLYFVFMKRKTPTFGPVPSWEETALLTYLGVHHEGTTSLPALPLPHSQVELGWKKHEYGCPLESPREKKKKKRKGYCGLITAREAGNGTCCQGEFAPAQAGRPAPPALLAEQRKGRESQDKDVKWRAAERLQPARPGHRWLGGRSKEVLWNNHCMHSCN